MNSNEILGSADDRCKEASVSDYALVEQELPWAQCPSCRCKIKFHGGWFPTEAAYANCGYVLKIKNQIPDVFLKYKYNEEGTNK